ncbi:hypothetical protein BGP_4614 [Beggiatoa sp. PS]|nr:hypothetical protein BGP_4614 [Beggiatoa sp. PS]
MTLCLILDKLNLLNNIRYQRQCVVSQKLVIILYKSKDKKSPLLTNETMAPHYEHDLIMVRRTYPTLAEKL